MKGDFQVRFRERLKLKCFGLLDHLLLSFCTISQIDTTENLDVVLD